MSGQKPMWQRMKEKFEEEERLEKERKENEIKTRDQKIRKILKELENGSTYVFQEDEWNRFKILGGRCLIPKAVNGEFFTSEYLITTIKIGPNIFQANLPLHETDKWILVERT